VHLRYRQGCSKNGGKRLKVKIFHYVPHLYVPHLREDMKKELPVGDTRAGIKPSMKEKLTLI
jgi:hypothetical protein